jgi:guanylate kinase
MALTGAVKKMVAASTLCSRQKSIFCRFYSRNPRKNMAARPLVLCGPSGVGKSTIVGRLTKDFGDLFGFSVSHTTRQPREGESDGVSYHFVDQETMKTAIDNDEFIETAVFSANSYGTSKAAVQSVVDQGRICILDIVSRKQD